MRASRGHLEERVKRQAGQIDRLIRDRDAFKAEAHATASALLRVAGELSRAKDVVASHIVFVGHPSTVLHSPQECMESLRQSLEDAGVDLRVELARLEGSDL